MSKSDLANTLGTLLSLDRVMIKDLMKLESETLSKMYANYIQNAKDANNKLERVYESRQHQLTTSEYQNIHKA